MNLAALPHELLTSELFGYERGAFTGAPERRAGLIRAAEGGTLFLDEIGDLSPAAQALLLRFLQQREVRSIGSSVAHYVDVRILAATNKNLHHAIVSERFRADLYDRVSEVVLEVPPLRQRIGDLPLLVDYFLERSAVRHGRPPTLRLARRARRLLESYSWPGNVRELQNVISGGVVLAEGGRVQAQHCGLPLDLLSLRQQEAVRIARLNGVVGRRDLTARFRVSGEAARRDLKALVDGGLLHRAGGGRGARYVAISGQPVAP